MLKCPLCGSDLIWQSDYMLGEISGEDIPYDEDRLIQTFTCSKCAADIEITHPSDNMAIEFDL